MPDGTWREYDPFDSSSSEPSSSTTYRIPARDFPSRPNNIPPEFWDRVSQVWLKTRDRSGDPGGGSSTEEEKKKPDPKEKTKPKTKPIPFPPTSTTTETKDEDGEPDAGDSKTDNETVDRETKAGGSGWLRPFFSTYHGLDILTLTAKEREEEIKDWDLFDLPVPVGQDLTNPLFTHQLKAQSQRFNGLGNPVNAKKPTSEQSTGQIGFMFASTGFVKGNMIYEKETQWRARAFDTQNIFIPADPGRRPTTMSGFQDRVPWRDPNKNSSGAASDQIGFGARDRSDPSYNSNASQQLFTQPDLLEAVLDRQIQEPTPSPNFYHQILKNVNTIDLFRANI
jgi:hypothetical protein